MKIVLFVLAVIAFVGGFIEGGSSLMIAAVFFSGAAVVDAIDRLGVKLTQETKKPLG